MPFCCTENEGEPDSQASGHGEHVEGFKAFSASGPQELPSLLRIERLDLFGVRLRRCRSLADVARKRPPLHGLAESTAQYRVNLPNRTRSQPGIQLTLVEGLDVIGCQRLELAPPELRLDVAADQALIALVCRGLHRALDRTVQPTVQERRESPILSLEDESHIPVRKGLRELLRSLLASLAVDGFPLRSSGRLDRVAGHVESIFAAADALFSVAAFTHA